MGMYRVMPEASSKPENQNPIADFEMGTVLTLLTVPKRPVLGLGLRWPLRVFPRVLSRI